MYKSNCTTLTSESILPSCMKVGNKQHGSLADTRCRSRHTFRYRMSILIRHWVGIDSPGQLLGGLTTFVVWTHTFSADEQPFSASLCIQSSGSFKSFSVILGRSWKSTLKFLQNFSLWESLIVRYFNYFLLTRSVLVSICISGYLQGYVM